MAVRTHTYKYISAPYVIKQKSATLVPKHRPRRCMVFSVGMMLAGLGVPFLMAIGLLPITLLLGFIGLALTATGGLMALIFYGEI